jgi:hypothetical protein
MEWSRDEITTLKMSVSWGDWAEEIGSILSKDAAEVRHMAEALGLTIKSFSAPQSPMPVQHLSNEQRDSARQLSVRRRRARRDVA